MLQSSSGHPRMGMCLPSTHMLSHNRLLSVFRWSIPYQSHSLSNELQQFLNNSFFSFCVFQTPLFAPDCPTQLTFPFNFEQTKPSSSHPLALPPKAPCIVRPCLPSLSILCLMSLFIIIGLFSLSAGEHTDNGQTIASPNIIPPPTSDCGIVSFRCFARPFRISPASPPILPRRKRVHNLQTSLSTCPTLLSM
jgi:hypothetical protein